MRLRSRGAVVLVALGLIASGCTKGDNPVVRPVTKTSERSESSSGTAGSVGGLAWGSCENRLARAANLECGRLAVPLDPSKPDGETTELVVARQNATGERSKRIGSLVLNPGGPGGSGIEFLAAAAQAFPPELVERFDLVSFDPRGVGESSPVKCLTDEQKAESLDGDLSPSTESEIDEVFKEQKEFLDGCKNNSSKLLEHMSTADVAADLDRIREALGDEKLTYAGFSYGTAIGAVYATLFPENTRALLLDGSVSPNASDAEMMLTQVKSFESVLAEFETACDASPLCVIGPDSASAIAKVRADLSASPVKVKSDFGTRTMGVDQFDLALATGLYDTSLWGVLAGAIAGLRTGGADSLFALMDQQTGRQADGSFNNSADAQTMVNCSDSSERPTRDEAAALAQQITLEAPTFGPAFGWAAASCIGWPKPENPVPTITGAGSAPILVVGTKGDPATPYSWSVAMADVLESATLLTYEGAGHTAFMKAGACIDNAVVGYLADLKMPAAGTSCPAAKDAISFENLSDQVISMMVKGGLTEDIARCIVKAAIDDIGEPEFNKLVLGQDSEAITQLIMAKTLSCVQTKAPK